VILLEVQVGFARNQDGSGIDTFILREKNIMYISDEEVFLRIMDRKIKDAARGLAPTEIPLRLPSS
jgi:hypothetical protein